MKKTRRTQPTPEASDTRAEKIARELCVDPDRIVEFSEQPLEQTHKPDVLYRSKLGLFVRLK